MLKHEIEDRIVGLLMGIGIGTFIGFFLRASERRTALRSQQP
jgi:hypothetical protein